MATQISIINDHDDNDNDIYDMSIITYIHAYIDIMIKVITMMNIIIMI